MSGTFPTKVNNRWCECLYHSMWLFVQNSRDNAGFAIVCTPLFGHALYHGLHMVQVNAPTLCKVVMTDNYPPASTSQGKLLKRLKVCTKVLFFSGINNTTRHQWWTRHSIHVHCNLSPCHCDSADIHPLKFKHTIFLWWIGWQTWVPQRTFSN